MSDGGDIYNNVDEENKRQLLSAQIRRDYSNYLEIAGSVTSLDEIARQQRVVAQQLSNIGKPTLAGNMDIVSSLVMMSNSCEVALHTNNPSEFAIHIQQVVTNSVFVASNIPNTPSGRMYTPNENYLNHKEICQIARPGVLIKKAHDLAWSLDYQFREGDVKGYVCFGRTYESGYSSTIYVLKRLEDMLTNDYYTQSMALIESSVRGITAMFNKESKLRLRNDTEVVGYLSSLLESKNILEFAEIPEEIVEIFNKIAMSVAGYMGICNSFGDTRPLTQKGAWPGLIKPALNINLMYAKAESITKYLEANEDQPYSVDGYFKGPKSTTMLIRDIYKMLYLG